jgi:hypothetical protein
MGDGIAGLGFVGLHAVNDYGSFVVVYLMSSQLRVCNCVESSCLSGFELEVQVNRC